MALKALNSVGGFSVGETPSNVIYPNGDFTGNKANFIGNIAALGLLTDNLYYANGTPWDLSQAAGSTGYVQFNDNGNFAASANFAFNSATNVLTVNGNIAGNNVNAGNLLTANYVTGTLTTNIQPNITSVGTLTGLTVSGVSNLGAVGNVIITGGTSGYYLQTNGSGNLTWAAVPSGDGIANGTSNVSIPVINGNVNLSAGGNTTLVVTSTGVNVAGTLNATGNANVDNIGTNTLIATTGNITTINSGLMQNGNSNVTIAPNGFIRLYVTSTERLVASSTGIAVAGEVTATTNVTAPQLISNTATGTAPFQVSSTTRVANLNVAYANVADNINVTAPGTGTGYVVFANATSGNVAEWVSSGITSNLANNSITATTFVGALSGTATNATTANTADTATTAGTVTTNAQPNITSVGTLISLNVSGNITAGANIVSTSDTFLVGATGANGDAEIGGTVGLIGGNGGATGNTIGGPVSIIAGSGSTGGNIGLTPGSGVGTDKSGGILTLRGGRGTGAGQPGNIIFQTADPIASGATAQTLANRIVISGNVVNVVTSVAATSTSSGAFRVVGGMGVGGNVYAGAFYGPATGLTSIPGANVTGTVPSATAATNASALLQNTSTATTVYPTFSTSSANGNSSAVINTSISANLGNASITATTFVGALSGAATTAGTVTTNSQPNITSVGTLTSLNVSGNANVGNLGTAQVLATANVTTPQLIANIANGTAPLLVNSQTLVANLNADLLDGYNTATAATANTVAVRDANGNITANYFIGNGSQLTGISLSSIANGTSNVSIPTSGGNVLVGVAGNANIVVVTGTGANITGTANVSGNANVGNLGTGGQILATGNITTNANIVTDFIAARTGNLTISASVANSSIILDPAGTGVVNVSGARISSLADPTFSSDAATKYYVDNAVSAGLNFHTAVNVETPTALTATYANGGTTPTWTSITTTDTLNTGSAHGLAVNDVIVFGSSTNGITAGTAYFVAEVPSATSIKITTVFSGSPITTLTNGTGLTITSRANSGVGATLTNSGTQVALQIDGVTLSINDRVLVYNQVVQAQNGIYTVTNVGSGSTNWVLTRATDADTYIPNSNNGMGTGDFFYVQQGLTGAGESYVNNTIGVIVFGTTDITFAQFSDTQIYTAGTGLALTGTQFRIANTTVTAASYGNGDRVATFTVNQQGQLTAAADAVITANAGNLTGTTLNSSIVTSSLTSVGTLGSLNVSGNANTGNLGTTTLIATTGNITTINSGLLQNGNSNVTITANGNVTINAVGGARITATSAGANVTGTLGVTGNITSGNADLGNLATANFFTGTLVNGTSNAYINGSGGNFLISVGGTANIVEVSASGLGIGNTDIGWGTVTTVATTANQTIAQFNVTGVTGVEFLVKGIDATGAKYSVATVTAVTDGTTADYSIYATAAIGGSTGTLVVNKTGSNLALQVTPSSSNSTVWTAQYRTI